MALTAWKGPTMDYTPQVEMIAREICRVRGIDPDSLVPMRGRRYRVTRMGWNGSAWENFADRVEDYLEVSAAAAKFDVGKPANT